MPPASKSGKNYLVVQPWLCSSFTWGLPVLRLGLVGPGVGLQLTSKGHAKE